MTRAKVVLSGLFYPMAILRYFEAALQRRDDIELFTVGPYTKNWIPWNHGMNLPMKYAKSPDLPLDKQHTRSRYMSARIVYPYLPWEPDLWLQVDANFSFTDPKANVVAHVATDPHVLDYMKERQLADHFFNMQKFYSQGDDIYLPYAADPVWHRRVDPDAEKEWDCSLIGLTYDIRRWLQRDLTNRGFRCNFAVGFVFDEYRDIYEKTRIAVNWSSKKDLIARVFENMLMGVPLVTNRVPDLSLHFEEGVHYLGFDDQQEAVEQIKRLHKYPEEGRAMAAEASKVVEAEHLYDHRISQILEVCLG